MRELNRAEQPFRFFTQLHLSELTGLRAANLRQLLKIIKDVPGSVIYHHTHHYLAQHHYLSPEPPNDFAYWVREVLGDEVLGERLASIDTVAYPTIRALREKIIHTLEEHLESDPLARLRIASEGEEFHFIKSVSFIFPTEFSVYDLREFLEALKRVSINSIYFHIFEARIRLEKPTNDFSYWLQTSLGEESLAKEIEALDPYTYTLEGLRSAIIKMIEIRTK